MFFTRFSSVYFGALFIAVFHGKCSVVFRDSLRYYDVALSSQYLFIKFAYEFIVLHECIMNSITSVSLA